MYVCEHACTSHWQPVQNNRTAPLQLVGSVLCERINKCLLEPIACLCLSHGIWCLLCPSNMTQIFYSWSCSILGCDVRKLFHKVGLYVWNLAILLWSDYGRPPECKILRTAASDEPDEAIRVSKMTLSIHAWSTWTIFHGLLLLLDLLLLDAEVMSVCYTFK